MVLGAVVAIKVRKRYHEGELPTLSHRHATQMCSFSIGNERSWGNGGSQRMVLLDVMDVGGVGVLYAGGLTK